MSWSIARAASTALTRSSFAVGMGAPRLGKRISARVTPLTVSFQVAAKSPASGRVPGGMACSALSAMHALLRVRYALAIWLDLTVTAFATLHTVAVWMTAGNAAIGWQVNSATGAA